MQHIPGEMELAHDAEMLAQGWSRWAIAALGADSSLIPNIGMSLRHHFATINVKEPKWVLSLIRAGNIPEWHTNYPFPVYQRKVESHRCRVASAFWELAKLWKQSPEVIRELKDAHGHNPIQSLGHAMVWFGETGTSGSGPAGAPYKYAKDADGESNYQKWRQDVVRHGRAIASLENQKQVVQAFLWLSKYYDGLWD
jgi:hypothetical protein